MNISNLPTDNLYKFVSLTGVVIALFCFVVIEYRTSQQAELDTEVSIGIEAFDSDIKQITKTLETDEKAIKAIEEHAGPIEREFTQDVSSAIDRYSEIKKRLASTNQEIMALRRKSEISENYYQRTLRIGPFMRFGTYFGITLACLGFYLWYFRLQKYQDMLLRNKAIGAAQQGAQADAEDSPRRSE